MRLILITLLLVSLAFGEDAGSAKTRSTIYMERLVRDTVLITKEAKIDTVKVKVSSIKYEHKDTVYSHHHLYFQFDLFSGVTSIFFPAKISAGIELSFDPKKSLVFNYHYSEKEPAEESSDVFDVKFYTGSILQHGFGLGYRYYFQPTRFAPYGELGANYLIRKTDYVNRDKESKNPASDKDSYKGYQPYVQFGLARREDRWAAGIAAGFAYNVVRDFDDKILDGHYMYVTSGLQVDLKINFSVGVL